MKIFQRRLIFKEIGTLRRLKFRGK